MKAKKFIALTILIGGTAAVCLRLGSQSLPGDLTRGPESSTNLLRGATDLRQLVFPAETISSLAQRGKIRLVTFDSSRNTEYPANEWTNVSAVLKTLRYTNRKARTPQIRIVQRNTIVQSERIYDGSGFDKSFLDWPLHAGDVVVVILPIDF